MSTVYTPSDRLSQQVERSFVYHGPKNDQPTRYESLRAMGRALAVEIIHKTPESREQSIALTKLEEAIFWANAAIARNE